MKGLDFVHVYLKTDKTLYSDVELKDDKAVVEFMRKEMMQYDREVMCLLNMTTKNKVINAQIVSVGAINESIINSREVFKSSILSNAANIILLHNHPSGNPEPSKADILITQKLVSAGNILGIEILDHIIIGGMTGESYSFAANDRMKVIKGEAAKYVKEIDKNYTFESETQKKNPRRRKTGNNHDRQYNMVALERALLGAQEGKIMEAVQFDKQQWEEKEKIYLHFKKIFVKKDILSSDGKRTFHAVTLPWGTEFMGEDLGGYQFYPMYVNAPYIFKDGKRTDKVDMNADYYIIPMLANYEIKLRRAVFVRDENGEPLRDEQKHYIYEYGADGKPIFEEKSIYPEELKNALVQQQKKWKKEHQQALQLRMPSGFCRTYINKESGEKFNVVVIPKGTYLDGVDISGYYFNPLYLNCPQIPGTSQSVRNAAFYEIPLLPDKEIWLKKDKLEKIDGILQSVKDSDGKKIYNGMVKCYPGQLQEALEQSWENYRKEIEQERNIEKRKKEIKK